MRNKRWGSVWLVTACLLAGCASGGSAEESTTAEKVEIVTTEAPTEVTTEEPTTEVPEEEKVTFIETGKEILFSHDSGFYEQNMVLYLKLEGEGTIYYTLDNTHPTKSSTVYKDGIHLMGTKNENPGTVCVRAMAILEDGTETQELAHTYMIDPSAKTRFTTDIFCLSGDPKEITGRQEGIFHHPNDRGRESEREVFITAFTADGEVLFEQFAGIRVYGGASRTSPLKSLKLFARKEYDPDHGKFKANLFDTEGYDGDPINKYSKLVLRNTGNDMQFAYIRDEYMQTLAKQAGFDTYEGVKPVVGYLNGEYYCFYWLHENYCDTYFKEKFGKADGDFIVLEGSDRKKSDEDEDSKQYALEYQEFYDDIIGKDLTNDAEYKRLTEFMDVENYLDYFAYNIYINNADWPQNNYKCYRYVPKEGETARDGVFDGRYRFLLHDMDYSTGLYEQRFTKANYDVLKDIMKTTSDRYSPLFTKLMQRQDCKKYFVEKILEFMNGVYSQQNMLKVLDEVDALRSKEMDYYYRYLENMRNNGHSDVWTRPDHLHGYMSLIRQYIASRPDYMIKFLQTDLSVTIQKEDKSYTLKTIK